RGKNLSIPSPFPLKLKITTPDNKILSEQRARFDDQGAVQFKVAIPSYARTGRYTAILTIGDNEEIGRTSFSVEEFIPDRMKVKLTTERDAYYAGENLKIDVEAVTLFGPPAARRQVDVSIEIEAFPFAPPAYKGFIFADGRKSFSRQEFKLGRQVLDDEGKRTYEYTIPDKFKPPSALRGIIAATVMEPGGRGVSAYKVVKIHPYDAYVGLRRLDKGYSGVNQENRIEFVLTSPEGRTVSGRKLEVSFYYVYWHSILRQAGRRQGYRYVSEEVEELQQRFTIDSHDDVASFSVTPEHYGRYRVVVCDVASGASASLWFYASGWGYSPWAMDNPDKVELDLDRESYLPGEKAQLQVRAPFPGKLLITIESDQVMEYQIATLEENTATLTIPVTAQFKPNVYIAVHLIRSTEKLKRDTPVRAFGVVPLMVDCEDQRLKVELDAPAEIRPCRELTVNFQVKGLTENTASVTIAAVDEGICQLTDFRTPNPHAHFLGKERLAVATHDIYSIILPEIESSSSSSSGDVEAARKRHLTPVSIKRVKPVSFWSGLIRTDAQGAGSVSFPIPQFSGTIRLMAVATCGNRFGNSEKKVIVRQPIELTPTFPRFLAGGDRFVIPVSVFNNTGSESTFEVSLQVSGPAKLTGDEAQKIKIASGREEMVHFNLEAGEGAGKIAFKLTASGNGERSEISVEVPLRPPVPFITLSGSGSIEEASPAIFTLPDDWLEGTVEFQLALSSFPAVKFARSLQYLLSYPHGCLEQTTSRLFPLLYFNDLARLAEPELFDRNSADYYIEEGITRLENMQLPSGAFSFWPGGSYTNDWSSLYATHFLIEARLAGYVVPDRVYDRMIEALDDYARDHGNGNREEYQTVAYACYLLSRTEKPDRSTMNFLRSLKRDKLSNYSRYQLAGAYAFAGDMATARTFLPRAAAPLSSKEERQTGGNFNSSVRTCAIMLDILAQVDPKNPMVPLLVQEVTASAAGRGCWYTTQENAFALLALGKIMRQQTEEDYRGHVVITGEEVLTFDTRSQSLSSGEWAGREVTIELTGKGTCYYYWRADGIPLNRDIDEYDHDLRVRRRYLDEEGNPLDHADFKQGDMLVAEITVKATAGAIANVAIVDLLPAGLEIENPRLQSRRSLKWIKAKARPAYIDFRDDRMILYTNLSHNGECKFYYSLRAVTQGDFVLPPICAEAMYAPMKASVAGSGRIKVVR
ncbi:MAG: alpha-2-macroglobulin family protein, partial [candidate division Zixibacteria bacterium]|nr:alpha-2-macroglobulin family protein [candidate division Zixibacteria bacterium]